MDHRSRRRAPFGLWRCHRPSCGNFAAMVRMLTPGSRHFHPTPRCHPRTGQPCLGHCHRPLRPYLGATGQILILGSNCSHSTPMYHHRHYPRRGRPGLGRCHRPLHGKIAAMVRMLRPGPTLCRPTPRCRLVGFPYCCLRRHQRRRPGLEHCRTPSHGPSAPTGGCLSKRRPPAGKHAPPPSALPHRSA